MTTTAVAAVMCSETGNPIPGRARKKTAPVANVTPTNPPIREMAIDSPSSNLEDAAAGKAKSAQDGDFPRAFADRHGHGVGADQQGGEDYGSADAKDECFDTAKRVDEIEFKRLFALALGGNRSAVEHLVDGVGGSRHVFSSVDASEIKARAVLEPVDGFFQIFGVEVERAVGRVDGVDAAQGQVESGGEDAALQDDVVADLPVVFFGKFNIGDAARAVALPGSELVGGHDFIRGDVEVFVGVGGKLGEVVFRFVVLILATEPSHRDDMHDPGNRANLVAIINGKEVRERYLVTGHDAKRGVRRSLVDVEAAPDAEHDAEQEQRKSDAGDRQQTAPLVAKRGFGDEAGDGHGSDNILHVISSPVETRLAPSSPRVAEDLAGGEPGVPAPAAWARLPSLCHNPERLKKVEHPIAPAAKRRHRKARHVSAGRQKGNAQESCQERHRVPTHTRPSLHQHAVAALPIPIKRES